MKTLPLLLLSAALATGAGAVTQVALRPAAATEGRAVAPGDSDELRAQVRELAQGLERVAQDVRELSARPVFAPAAEMRAPEIDVEGAVRRYLDEHQAELGAARALDAPAGAAAAPAEVDVDALLAELLAPDLDHDAAQAIWDRAREAGRLDELVALFERRAEERPKDPDAQLEVGNAYLQKIFDSPDGPARGAWATRADEAFDRALALDPNHWDARFTKAVSLSFWPPLFGKQADAIRHFEVLVEQQKNAPLEEHHADTYELLGNLYEQTGQGEKAAEIWRAGAALFPQNGELARKASLATSGG